MADLSQLSDEQLQVYKDLLISKSNPSNSIPKAKPPTPAGLVGPPPGRLETAVNNLPSSLLNAVRHPSFPGMPVDAPQGEEELGPTPEKVGRELSGYAHSFMHPEEDPVGAGLTLAGGARGILKHGTATTVASPEGLAEVAGGATKGAYKGGTEMVPMRHYGIPLDVPAPVAGAAVGGFTGWLSHLPYGREVGSGLGAAAPIVRGGYGGLKDSLQRIMSRGGPKAAMEDFYGPSDMPPSAEQAMEGLTGERAPNTEGLPPGNVEPPKSLNKNLLHYSPNKGERSTRPSRFSPVGKGPGDVPPSIGDIPPTDNISDLPDPTGATPNGKQLLRYTPGGSRSSSSASRYRPVGPPRTDVPPPAAMAPGGLETPVAGPVSAPGGVGGQNAPAVPSAPDVQPTQAAEFATPESKVPRTGQSEQAPQVPLENLGKLNPNAYDQAKLAKLREAKGPEDVPPIDVSWNKGMGLNGKLMLDEGNHRLAVAREKGWPTIGVNVKGEPPAVNDPRLSRGSIQKHLEGISRKTENVRAFVSDPANQVTVEELESLRNDLTQAEDPAKYHSAIQKAKTMGKEVYVHAKGKGAPIPDSPYKTFSLDDIDTAIKALQKP